MAGLRIPLMILIIASLVVYLVALFLNYQAVIGIGIFTQPTAAVSDKYYVNMTPAGYTFSIWGVIYTWLMAMLIYCQTTLCRTNKTGPVYLYPQVLTATFYAVFILVLFTNISWLLLWDRELLQYSSAMCALMLVSLIVCLATSHKELYNNLEALRQNDQQDDINAIRVLVHNGVAIYASWVVVATFLNLCTVLVYWVGAEMETACVICLTIITVAIIAWFIVENFVIEKYARYTLTNYPTLLWALAGILAGNYNPELTSSIVTVVMTVLVAILFIVRIVLVVYRSITQPLSAQSTDTKLLI
ncbi:uncharacterized protein [Ptychodera flava]|uniref:uncharacterized protein n=1 Tax=Ptychodera flava TaxID=63121 RepID=UPI00396A97B6